MLWGVRRAEANAPAMIASVRDSRGRLVADELLPSRHPVLRVGDDGTLSALKFLRGSIRGEARGGEGAEGTGEAETKVSSEEAESDVRGR